MRELFRSNLRSLLKNWTKILAMTLILALGFAFIFGVSITPSKVRDSFDTSLKERKASDFLLMSDGTEGFSEGALSALKGIEGAHSEGAMLLDGKMMSAYGDDGSLDLEEIVMEYLRPALVNNGMTEDEALSASYYALGALPKGEQFECFLTLTPSLLSDKNDRIISFTDRSLGEEGAEVNELALVEGEFPDEEGEILVDHNYRSSFAIGDTATLFGKDFEIVGFADFPLYFSNHNEVDYIDLEEIDDIFYHIGDFGSAPSIDSLIQAQVSKYVSDNSAAFQEISEEVKKLTGVDLYAKIEESISSIAFSLPTQNACFLRFEERDSLHMFSSDYDSFLENKEKEVAEALKDVGASFSYIGKAESVSFRTLELSCRKMDVICYLIPVFFLAVDAFVISISMSRIITDERPSIACLSSLGYKDGIISIRYLLMALLSSVLGIGLGLLIGYYAVFPIIYNAFGYPFALPSAMASSIDMLLTGVSIAAMLVLIIGVTAVNLKRAMHPLPALLLLPKSPGLGAGTSLDKIPFWKHFPFRLKSVIRNLVRYKKRFLMISVSVAGSGAILFIGFALLDIVNKMGTGQADAISKAIVPVSKFLILFAVILVALVLYNLTDMSVTERSRELATLDVLGYRSAERSLYLYREIVFTTVLGSLFGLPLGLLLMWIVVYYLGFGSLTDITVTSYLFGALIPIAFGFLIDLSLLPKILHIDMISSLKSVD